MWTRDSLHEPIVVTPSDAELFKCFLPKEMMALGGIVDAEFEELWRQDGVLFKLRKAKDPARTLLGGYHCGLLKTGLKDEFAEWRIAIEQPVSVYTPGDITGPPRKADRIGCRGPVFGGYFPSVVKNQYASPGEKGLHSIEHLLHASAVVLILLVQLAQDIHYNQIGRLSSNYALNEVLAALVCHQEGEQHVVLVDKPQIWYGQIIPDLLELAEALSPRGFLGVKLKIEHFFWPWARVTHHGIAFSYPGGDVKCEKAFSDLWRAKKEHITGLWDEPANQPFKLGSGGTQVLGGGDGSDHG